MEEGIEGNHMSTAATAYTKSRLHVYELMLQVITGPLWGSSPKTVVDFYNEHVSGNHLDVGVGTGYFLDRCRYPVERPRIVLMDSNADPLDYAATRLSRYAPVKFKANILAPIPFDGEKFDSIGLNYVLHCLPGTMREKGVPIEHLKALMNPRGVLFGATVLGQGVTHNFFGAKWLEHFNKNGVLDNLRDNSADLKAMLDEHFSASTVRVVGRTAFFTARK
jgi:hypothetical protein